MMGHSVLEEEGQFQLEKWGGHFRQRDEVRRGPSGHRVALGTAASHLGEAHSLWGGAELCQELRAGDRRAGPAGGSQMVEHREDKVGRGGERERGDGESALVEQVAEDKIKMEHSL